MLDSDTDPEWRFPFCPSPPALPAGGSCLVLAKRFPVALSSTLTNLDFASRCCCLAWNTPNITHSLPSTATPEFKILGNWAVTSENAREAAPARRRYYRDRPYRAALARAAGYQLGKGRKK